VEPPAGDKLTVPTLTGPIEVPLPDGGSDAPLRLPGLGLPKRIGGGERGDLVVRLKPALQAARDAVADSPLRRDGRQSAVSAKEFQSRKAAARQSLQRGAFEHVVQLLDATALDDLHDAESHGLLSVARAQLNDLTKARQHLVEAIHREPWNPMHRYNLGLVALRKRDYLEAALSLEAALRCGDNRPQTRQTLTQALSHLFNPMLVVFGDRALNERMQQSCHLAQHRMYGGAAKMMERIRQTDRGAERLTFMEACAKLLACLTGSEELLAEAIDLFEVLHALHPDWEEPRRGREVAMGFVERESGVLGLVACACDRARRGQFGEACRLMGWAVARLHTRAPTSPSRDGHGAVYRAHTSPTPDPVAGKQSALLQRYLAELKSLLRHRPEHDVAVPFLRGLAALVESQEATRRRGLVSVGWLPAVRAVRDLELALCQKPDDADIMAQFQNALDWFSGVASAMLNEMDPNRLAFYQNTYDAAIQALIPESPLNARVQPGAPPTVLRELCETAYRRLFDRTRAPLRGEFLVAMLDGHFVLTNYRLLLMTDRLPLPQLLPLNSINRYTVRASGISTATIIVGLAQGRQLVLNDLASGTFPTESLVSYLIGARMWESLQAAEQSVLAAGHGHPPPAILPAEEPAPPRALPSATTSTPPGTDATLANLCTHCGNAAKVGDLFCRQCGNRLVAPPTPDPSRMLGEGG
ncbi:MAG: hypothetical protein NZT92_15895, partial [Abditibacteriales bacterium]|nr:hypothetical protein [Abditibacteriales bacterium]MDW8367413.1 hypothetical protein [Abditibacteriales bacterium]